MQKRNIILFELNEVPLRILDVFIRWNPRSILARKLPFCKVYETISEDCIKLSPWVTWPSLYRGVNDEKHLIEHFGQNLSEVDEQYPPIWKILVSQGVKVGVFGTLHTYPIPKDVEDYSFYVPDTFAAGKECFPTSIEPFQDFNLSMARNSPRNVAGGVPWGKALTLLRSLPDLGIRSKTIVSLAGQLAIERVHDWKKIRRRTYQPMIAFDIFMTQLERTRPQFSTFFTNHVASSMHRYWAASFPEDYNPTEYQFDQEWRIRYGAEIAFTMSKFDEMFARLVQFVNKNPNWLLVVATSMGQHATTAKPLETQLYITNLPKFMASMGLEELSWSQRPAMAPQVSVFVIPDRQELLRKSLSSMRVNGQPVEWHEKDLGFFSISFGQENLDGAKTRIEIGGRTLSTVEMGMENVEIQDKSNTTAYHIPAGSLLMYDPRQTSASDGAGRPQVSTLDIAPFIISTLGVPVPDYMLRPTPLMTI
jgi:hypothetical protein